MTALRNTTWALIILFCFQLTSCSAHRPEKQMFPIIRPIHPPSMIVTQAPKPIAQVAPPLREHPRNGMLIIVDPGHGGKDLGAHSTKTPKYQEKVLTLSASRMLKGYLEQLGYTVDLTRNKDQFVDLYERANFANKRKPAAFVSVHFNSAPSREAEGVEVFYCKSDKDKNRTESSKDLATAVLNRIIVMTDAKSRGVKQKDFAVIRETNMAAILVEGGFLTNANEVVKLKDPSYLKLMAWGIAQGIDAYLQSNE